MLGEHFFCPGDFVGGPIGPPIRAGANLAVTPGQYLQGMDDELVAHQTEQMWQFLSSPQARGYATKCLRMGELNELIEADDLLSIAAHNVVRRLRSGGPLTRELDRRGGIDAYCTVVINRAAKDLLRAASRRPHLVLSDDIDDVGEPVPDAAGTETYDVVRSALHQRVHHTRVWPTAAALAFVTVTEFPDRRLGDTVPTPKLDDVVGQAEWAGLHYAGRHDCFAQVDTPAVRQQRSRAIRQVRAELAAAARPTHDDQNERA